MPLTFKLIINNILDEKLYELTDNFKGIINLQLLTNLFKFWKFTNEEIQSIKFILDSEHIVDTLKNYLISPDENKIIYIYVPDVYIRLKLQQIFAEIKAQKNPNNKACDEKSVDSSNKEAIFPPEIFIQTNLEVKTQKEIIINELDEVYKSTKNIAKLTPELINVMNVKTSLLFQDSDFKNLIHIYLKKPELYTIFLKFIQNADIIEEASLPAKELHNLTDEELTYYYNLCDEIRKLNINISNEIIINRLIKYSGHLNLTLRSLLLDLKP